MSIIYLLLVVICHPLKVKILPGFNSNNYIQYPNLRPYSKYSCACLTNLNLEASNFLTIDFIDLVQGETLCFEINHPPYIEFENQVPNVNSTYTAIIPLNSFEETGLMVALYFKEAGPSREENHEFHFTLTNTTEPDKSFLESQKVDDSFFILTILVGVSSVFFGSFTRIYRFRGLNIRWYHFLIYCISVSIYVAILYTVPFNVFKIFQTVVTGLLSLFCSYYYIEEIIAACKIRYKIGRVEIRDIIAVMMAVGLIVMWIYSDNNWVFNDLLGLLIVGTVIKLVKIGSMRAATVFMVIILTFNIAFQVIFMTKERDLASMVVNDYPSPLQFQIPTIDFFINKRCAWVEITDMIFPGFLINYCRRIDKSLNMSVYTILSYVAIVISVGIQILIYVVGEYTIELPQAIFSIPLLLLLLFVVSKRRGEWSIVWHGGFYDTTAERRFIRRSVEWDIIGHNLDQQLLIN